MLPTGVDSVYGELAVKDQFSHLGFPVNDYFQFSVTFYRAKFYLKELQSTAIMRPSLSGKIFR